MTILRRMVTAGYGPGDGTLVDGNAQRAQLVGQAVLLGLAWLLDAPALVVLTGVVLGVGAIGWPRAALFVRLHERVVVPRLPAVPPVDGRPPRFSAALGALTYPLLGGLLLAGFDTAGWALVLLGVGAMVAEAVMGRCAPCELFVWAARRGVLPTRRPVAWPS